MFSLPDHVGMPVGDSEDPMMFIMEVHYDNPRLLSGKTVLTQYRESHKIGINKYLHLFMS